ncbi:haloacid dehalogenase type II [Streptomyces albidus (ex Kaewkla and Franco 2022)]|uniref:haloacid dehalogenase type II n=1 Tax=Streptomyces albidus (ex Kaewkla and Franco 2022) TaxID=722709 RepID=UPI0015EEA676|nr:haloacid dehalogenase type II [Streptomyces albidus (ex Kaewkla and Franco 2022)]
MSPDHTDRTDAGALRVVVFDVNETLSDMTPLRSRFEDVGAPGHLLPTWFTGVLRDGFALTAAGSYADFADVARDGLLSLLPDVPGWSGDADAAARHILAGLAELNVHPDIPAGVRALREAGLRLVTMTNGDPALTEGLLERAGVRDHFDTLLGVGGPRCWKPVPEAYRYAVRMAGVEPGEAVLVAVHPWDVDGAQRAGLAGAWLRRGSAGRYPETLTPPDWSADDLEELARSLARERRRTAHP